MRKVLGCALVVVALATASAPAVSADSSKWRDRPGIDCGAAGSIDFVLPPSEFLTAFVPLHEAGGTRILTIQSVTVDGDTYVAKPMTDKAPARLVTCSYVDPAGLSISIEGLLTPGK